MCEAIQQWKPIQNWSATRNLLDVLTSLWIEARLAIIWQLLWNVITCRFVNFPTFQMNLLSPSEGRRKTRRLRIHLPSPLSHWNEYTILMLVIVADWFYIFGDDLKGFNCYRTVWVTFGLLNNTRTYSLSSLILSLYWSLISIGMPSPSGIILSLYWSLISIRMPSPSDVILSLYWSLISIRMPSPSGIILSLYLSLISIRMPSPSGIILSILILD